MACGWRWTEKKTDTTTVDSLNFMKTKFKQCKTVMTAGLIFMLKSKPPTSNDVISSCSMCMCVSLWRWSCCLKRLKFTARLSCRQQRLSKLVRSSVSRYRVSCSLKSRRSETSLLSKITGTAFTAFTTNVCVHVCTVYVHVFQIWCVVCLRIKELEDEVNRMETKLKKKDDDNIKRWVFSVKQLEPGTGPGSIYCRTPETGREKQKNL